MKLYFHAFLVVGFAFAGAGLMKWAGCKTRLMDVAIVCSSAGLMLLFSLPSEPFLAMALALLSTMGLCFCLERKGKK